MNLKIPTVLTNKVWILSDQDKCFRKKCSLPKEVCVNYFNEGLILIQNYLGCARFVHSRMNHGKL